MTRGWNKPIRVKADGKDSGFNKGIKLGFAFVGAFTIIVMMPTIVRLITEAFEAGI